MSNSLMAWQETNAGRRRLWCKMCRDEGEEWLTDTPCEHIQTATPGEIISAETAQEMLRAVMREPSHYPMTSTKPEPGGSAKIPYNEGGWDPKPNVKTAGK